MPSEKSLVVFITLHVFILVTYAYTHGDDGVAYKYKENGYDPKT
jgi:hypothetical protein